MYSKHIFNIVLLMFISGLVNASAWHVIHTSNYTKWAIYNISAYQQNSVQIDNVINQVDSVAAQLQKDFGIHSGIVNVNISSGGCCGGSTSNGQEGLSIGDFATNVYLCSGNTFSALNWTEGVAIGELVNTYTGSVTSGWPRDWWVDDVWYFPAMSVIQSTSEIGNTRFSYMWEMHAAGGCTPYPSLRVFEAFDSARSQYGWSVFSDAFSNMTLDKFSFDNLKYANGSLVPNPSALRTEYAIAYLSVKHNVSQLFVNGISGTIKYNVNQSAINVIKKAIQEINEGVLQGIDMNSAISSLDSGAYSEANSLAYSLLSRANTTAVNVTKAANTTNATQEQKYLECFYSQPNATGLGMYVGNVFYSNDQSALLLKGAYPIRAAMPENYSFRSWVASNGIVIANASSANTTALFEGFGSNGICAGSIAATYLLNLTVFSTNAIGSNYVNNSNANSKNGPNVDTYLLAVLAALLVLAYVLKKRFSLHASTQTK